MTVLAPPVALEVPAPAARVRSSALDRLRGLAVVLMVLDHVLLCFFVGFPAVDLRMTLTRLAMPLFAVLAGHLAYRDRFSRKWFLALLAGVLVPVVVPFIDNPNILVWLFLGALVVWCSHRLGAAGRVVLAVLVAVPLTRYANGFPADALGSYDSAGVAGLMALGALLSRELLEVVGSRLPRLLALAGRWPLSLYVGHLLLLEAVLLFTANPVGFYR